jgi:hypothetical protein
LLCAVLAVAAPSGAPAAPTEALSSTPPPEIYHGVSRPLCSALQTRIRPAIGMMIQNDQTIAKSPPMFNDYISSKVSGSDGRTNLAVMHLENLVTPLVNNILAIQKLLEDPSVFPLKPQTDDEKRLALLKDQMFKALAAQQAALDVISGFVDTQQLSAMQHEGFGYISSITNPDVAGQTNQAVTAMTGGSPNQTRPPVFDDTALHAGLAPNPQEIDLTTIPGLEVGYNPLNRLRDGVVWTQDQSKKAEATLADTVVDTARMCNPQSAATPSPSPKP